MKGMTYGDILGMTSQDRTWYLARLYSQLRQEADEMKRAAPKK
jgi:hypothetical protein